MGSLRAAGPGDGLDRQRDGVGLTLEPAVRLLPHQAGTDDGQGAPKATMTTSTVPMIESSSRRRTGSLLDSKR